MRKQMVYLDMDGVIASWVRGHLDWYKIQDNSSGNLPYGFILNHVTEAQINSLKGNYLFWKRLPKYRWADQLVEMVRSLSNDWRFLTLATNEMGCYGGKIDWIKEHFPQHAHRLVIAQKEKTFACKNGDILIDDYQKNIDEWKMANGNPFHWEEISFNSDATAQEQLKRLETFLVCNT